MLYNISILKYKPFSSIKVMALVNYWLVYQLELGASLYNFWYFIN